MKNTFRGIKHLLSLERPGLQTLKKILLVQEIAKIRWYLLGRPLPPPHFIKQGMIHSFIEEFKYTHFVETGTYLGAMISTVLHDFKRIYTVELSKPLHERATKLFKKYEHVRCLQGDSGVVLKELVNQLNEGTIFWLDGHYSGGITALGEKECPIYEELDAIMKRDSYNHIILIDDARLFLKGAQDYPLYDVLVKYIKDFNSSYNIYLFNTDTIVVTKNNLNEHSRFNNHLQKV